MEKTDICNLMIWRYRFMIFEGSSKLSLILACLGRYISFYVISHLDCRNKHITLSNNTFLHFCDCFFAFLNVYKESALCLHIWTLQKRQKVFFTLLIKAKTFTLLHAGWTQERFKVCHFTDANAGRQAPKQQSEPLNEFICKSVNINL